MAADSPHPPREPTPSARKRIGRRRSRHWTGPLRAGGARRLDEEGARPEDPDNLLDQEKMKTMYTVGINWLQYVDSLRVGFARSFMAWRWLGGQQGERDTGGLCLTACKEADREMTSPNLAQQYTHHARLVADDQTPRRDCNDSPKGGEGMSERVTGDGPRVKSTESAVLYRSCTTA